MKVKKRALITGITGQDGSYLAELLLSKDYAVHGMVRRSSVFNTERIDHILDHERLDIYYGDLTDSSNLNRLLEKIEPDEIYNLAAQSHVKVSFDVPEYTAEVGAMGTLRFLDAIKESGLRTRFYQASTSELFGNTTDTPQTETTRFYPRSPYAVAKLYAYWAIVNYREAYGIYACNGILFNHESPRRGATFVSRKIARAGVRIQAGLQDCLILGNLDARRDWGYAPEYVEGMWRMLQQDEPSDYVLATGKSHTVREFVEQVFDNLEIELIWDGTRENEIGVDKKTDKILVKIDPRYFRPTEVDHLKGDATKAKTELGWCAETTFQELVELMVRSEKEVVDKELLLIG